MPVDPLMALRSSSDPRQPLALSRTTAWGDDGLGRGIVRAENTPHFTQCPHDNPPR
jgi:hypothetical protein